MAAKDTLETLVSIHKRLSAEARKTLSLIQSLAKEEGDPEVKESVEAYLDSQKSPGGRSPATKIKLPRKITRILNLLKKMDDRTLDIVEKMVKIQMPPAATRPKTSARSLSDSGFEK